MLSSPCKGVVERVPDGLGLAVAVGDGVNRSDRSNDVIANVSKNSVSSATTSQGSAWEGHLRIRRANATVMTATGRLSRNFGCQRRRVAVTQLLNRIGIDVKLGPLNAFTHGGRRRALFAQRFRFAPLMDPDAHGANFGLLWFMARYGFRVFFFHWLRSFRLSAGLRAAAAARRARRSGSTSCRRGCGRRCQVNRGLLLNHGHYLHRLRG